MLDPLRITHKISDNQLLLQHDDRAIAIVNKYGANVTPLIKLSYLDMDSLLWYLNNKVGEVFYNMPKA